MTCCFVGGSSVSLLGWPTMSACRARFLGVSSSRSRVPVLTGVDGWLRFRLWSSRWYPADSSVLVVRLGGGSVLSTGPKGTVLRRPSIALGVRWLTKGDLRLLRFPVACNWLNLALRKPLGSARTVACRKGLLAGLLAGLSERRIGLSLPGPALCLGMMSVSVQV
jgi:hypothetical protein